ncbi:MAG: ATP-binding protein [Deltaproteobacteria bacterium]|nr:ATP-binding protein [Deltaproteobacteria bacterium]
MMLSRARPDWSAVAPAWPDPRFSRPAGVGKTHLAISLAVVAAESGRRVYYGTLAGLIESLMDAKTAGNLSRRLRVLTHPALLVVDEIGYLPVTQDGAVLFLAIENCTVPRRASVQI